MKARLLIISDDLTGALDTGVMFVKAGAEVRVCIGEELPELTAEVMVMDAETRHLTAERAYRVVYEQVRKAKEAGISCIYKKTDSALRGNIGAELSAALRASGEKILHFIPAFPEMNRYTKNGIHYIDGVPVSESVFGKDPFNPVRQDGIKEIIAEQSDITVAVVRGQEQEREEAPSCTGNIKNRPFLSNSLIRAYDVTSEEELRARAAILAEKGELKLLAGCAGFAGELPKLLGLGDGGGGAPYGGSWDSDGENTGRRGEKDRFLVVCGSVNPITVAQLDYAEEKGFRRIRLNNREKLEGGFWRTEEGQKRLLELREEIDNSGDLILDSNEAYGVSELSGYIREKELTAEEIRTGITGGLGELLTGLLDLGVKRTLMVVGGDTLLGFLKKAEIGSIRPLCELRPGTVMTEIEREGESYRLITKSGGFGDAKLLPELSGLISKKTEN